MIEVACAVVVAFAAVAAIGLALGLVGFVVKATFDLALLPLALLGAVIKGTVIAVAAILGVALLVTVGLPLLALLIALAAPVLLLAGLAWAALGLLGLVF